LTQIRNVKCQQVDGKKIEIYCQNYNVTGAMKIYLEDRYFKLMVCLPWLYDSAHNCNVVASRGGKINNA
jgi:hypothetical protein